MIDAEAGGHGIVQITTGGAAYLAGASADPVLGARVFAAAAHELASAAPVFVAVHTDRAPAAKADAFLRPLLPVSAARVRAGGIPLFHSHMFDGSALPLEEKLRASARWLEAAREADVALGVEVGVVGGAEDDVDGTAAGVPVNVTRLFSLDRHPAVAESYLRGVERLMAGGGDPRTVTSVASFFLSRMGCGRRRAPVRTWARGPSWARGDRLRWERLVLAGATPQRALWASTSVKDADTETFATSRNSWAPTRSPRRRPVSDARNTLDQRSSAGVDLGAVSDELERNGVHRFVAAQASVLQQLATTATDQAASLRPEAA